LTAQLIGKRVLLEHSSKSNSFVTIGNLLTFTGGRYNILGPVVPGESYARIILRGVAIPNCLLPFPVKNYTMGRHLMSTLGDAFWQKIPVIWRVENLVLSHSDGFTVD
jgi:hypothetical protein